MVSSTYAQPPRADVVSVIVGASARADWPAVAVSGRDRLISGVHRRRRARWRLSLATGAHRHAYRRRQEHLVLRAAARLEADVCSRCGCVLPGEASPARILSQHDRADVPLLWQHGAQQCASDSAGPAARRLVHLAGVVGSACFALDFIVGPALGGLIGPIL